MDEWHKDLTDMANKKKEEVKYNWGVAAPVLGLI